MIFAQLLSIGLQCIFLLTLVNITHSLIRVKPVGVVAQAYIDSNTCGSCGAAAVHMYWR